MSGYSKADATLLVISAFKLRDGHCIRGVSQQIFRDLIHKSLSSKMVTDPPPHPRRKLSIFLSLKRSAFSNDQRKINIFFLIK